MSTIIKMSGKKMPEIKNIRGKIVRDKNFHDHEFPNIKS